METIVNFIKEVLYYTAVVMLEIIRFYECVIKKEVI